MLTVMILLTAATKPNGYQFPTNRYSLSLSLAIIFNIVRQ